MERSNVVITLGGKTTGAACVLLPLAEEQRKIVLPLTFMGGAAEQSYLRRKYELEDRLNERISALNDYSRVGEAVSLVEHLACGTSAPRGQRIPQRFFISYARSRPHEADFVEMMLRRRNVLVTRDEQDFGAGQLLPRVITEHIYRADVFVALWCKEYACSPWCFDELDLALRRQKSGGLTLWLLCIDDTRIVPPAARDLVFYPAPTREMLEGRVRALLEQLAPCDIDTA